jgi:hypothetical protein
MHMQQQQNGDAMQHYASRASRWQSKTINKHPLIKKQQFLL